ncbi:protein kinase, partial [Streptomyces calidiresistens]|nr:protein kinase [Streptomyces calidiresistens]
MARNIGSQYTLHRVLGRGSAGTVWLADGPDGPVAVKVMREDLAADPELVERFVHERHTLLGLEHPNIVGVRDLITVSDPVARREPVGPAGAATPEPPAGTGADAGAEPAPDTA